MKKLSIQNLLTVCACLVFLTACNTTQQILQSVTTFLKSPCAIALEKVEAKYAAGEYDEALQELESSKNQCVSFSEFEESGGVPIQDKLLAYYCNLADSYTKNGQYEEALNTVDMLTFMYSSYTIIKPKKVEIYLGQASEYFEKKKYTTALEAVNEALKLSGGNEEAKKLQSDINFELAKIKMPKTMAKIDKLFKTFHQQNLLVNIVGYTYEEGEKEMWIECDFMMGLFTYGQVYGFSNKGSTEQFSVLYDDLLTVMEDVYPQKHVNGTLLFLLYQNDPFPTASQSKLVRAFTTLR